MLRENPDGRIFHGTPAYASAYLSLGNSTRILGSVPELPEKMESMNGSPFHNGESSQKDAPHANSSVQDVVQAAHDELQDLIRQRSEIMKRIGTVKQTIVGLANLFGDNILSDDLQKMLDRKSSRQMGFTKACRIVLMEASRPLGAREVCEQIQERIAPVIERHKDPLASVTTVLNRLVEYGEAKAVVRENGRRAWEWVSEGPAQLANTAMPERNYSELSS
jgi:hypothetical protein